MHYEHEKDCIDPRIVDWFTKTLLPFYSWFVSLLLSGVVDCDLTIVLMHPTNRFKDRVARTLVDYGFTCAEILCFQTASGRRRGRKSLKKALRPFLRELKRSQEFFLIRQLFWKLLQQERTESGQQVRNEAPVQIPTKARVNIDIGELDERVDQLFSTYSRDDILRAFPIGSTLADPVLKKRVSFELQGYPSSYADTVGSLLWQASWDWDLLRGVRIRSDSSIWKILGWNPDDTPDLSSVIESSFDFAAHQVNEDKVRYVTRWFMDRIVVSRFIPHPYSGKRFGQYTGLERAEENEVTLPLSDEDRLARFCELSGIETALLTPGDSRRILEYFHALDADYAFGSKKGVPIQAYFGGRADSEKTQRQRLFKKLREARRKMK